MLIQTRKARMQAERDYQVHPRSQPSTRIFTNQAGDRRAETRRWREYVRARVCVAFERMLACAQKTQTSFRITHTRTRTRTLTHAHARTHTHARARSLARTHSLTRTHARTHSQSCSPSCSCETNQTGRNSAVETRRSNTAVNPSPYKRSQ